MIMIRLKRVFLILSSTALLAGCAISATQIKVVKYYLGDNDAFSITTDLEEEKTIHTDRQATYLSYDGDYSTIPEEDYPDGQQHLSEPEAVTLTWAIMGLR